MAIYLIRHTSVGVKKGVCYGQTDVPVSASFEGEATAVRLQIGDICFSRVYSSPLTRCRQLADAALLRSQNCSGIIQIDERIMELNFGNWEMKNWSDLEQTPEAQAWFADYTQVKCPNGEAFIDMVERIRAFHAECCINSDQEDIAIFTHAGAIRSFMVVLEGITPQESFNRDVAYGEIIIY